MPLYPDIITAAGDCGTPYYTNSSHLPVGFTDDVFSALDIQDQLQTLYTSGTVFHAFLGEKLPSWESAAQLVRKISENYKLPYYTLSPTYSVCTEHGYLAGEQEVCPICGKKTEVYSRITGYYRPVQNWNDGKQQEFKDRKTYARTRQENLFLCESCSITKNVTPADNGVTDELQKTEFYSNSNAKESQRQFLLFTTSTCPKCVMAKKFLADAGINYETVVVDKNPEPAKQFNVRQAPTLLVLEDNVEAQRVENPSNIRAFAEENK